jgi:RNA polymerase sigma-70 factor (ECF subfamily)
MNSTATTNESKAPSSQVPSLGELADDQLMRRVKRGDHLAYEEFYRRLYPQALRAAARVCRNPSAAEEATQEAFVTAWRNASRFDEARGNARSWLMCMVQTRAIDVLRRDQRHDQRRASDDSISERIASDANIGLQIEHDETARDVQAALGHLPAAQRDALFLAYFNGLTQQEIADHAGIPVGTVKGRIRLGLEKLSHELESTRALAA